MAAATFKLRSAPQNADGPPGDGEPDKFGVHAKLEGLPDEVRAKLLAMAKNEVPPAKRGVTIGRRPAA